MSFSQWGSSVSKIETIERNTEYYAFFASLRSAYQEKLSDEQLSFMHFFVCHVP